MRKTLILFVLSLLSFVAWGQQLYSYKSGSYDLVVNMSGQKMTTHVVFADYGALQYTEMNMFGQDIKTVQRDGKSYMTAPEFQEVTQEDTVNYNDLSQDVIDKYGIKMVGLEEKDGYDCMVYTLTMSAQGFEGKGKVWVWEGFQIRSEVSVMGMKIVTNLKNLELDVPVDMSLFDLPK